MNPELAGDRLEKIARAARAAAVTTGVTDPDTAARNAVANARAVLGYNALDHVPGWAEAMADAEGAGTPEGFAYTTPPPRTMMDVIHARETRKADFLYACPGLSEGVRDLIQTAINFARRRNLRPEQIGFDNPRCTRSGIVLLDMVLIRDPSMLV